MRTCTVEGCESKHYGRGLCERHWHRARDRQRGLYKNPRFAAPEMSEPTYGQRAHCEVPGCDSPHKAKGFCHVHYMRNYRATHHTPAGPRKPRKEPNACGIPNCERAIKSNNLCHYHYLQYWRALNPDKYTEQNKRNASAYRARKKGKP